MGRQDASAKAGWEAFAVQLGHNLQQARVGRSMTQGSVAYRAGLTRYTYQMYELGKAQSQGPANPTLRILLALSQVLEVPLHELLPSDVPDVTTR
ncbi:helix-turn-helix transcriptional regulator [Microbacterium sp. SZ1]|uniref:helix-turn-helix transcriptional regulator n=1 Tax=Microbacterium sp. SZ1 TaxID=1849736 RepID=UPI00211CDB36|nr:helix-turn-helix transcriptional regulator [Microbacterium sp. SZ1]